MNSQLQLTFQQVIEAFQGENFDGARSILQQVLQNDINNADAIFELSMTYAKVSRFTEASIILRCLQLYKLNDVRVPYNLGLIYSIQGNHIEALSAYNLALQIRSDDVEVLVNKASTYNDIQNYVLALETLERAIQIKADIPEAWSNKGIALNNLNLFNESICAYNEATKLNPSYYEAWSNKSIPLNRLKKFFEASEACDKALALNPNYAEAWSNKGITLYELKSYDEAIAHCDKALSIKPDFPEAWFNKGLILSEQSRALDARTCFEKAIELKPNFHKSRWAKLFTHIPVIANGDENIDEQRRNFFCGLEELGSWFQGKNLEKGHEVVGFIQPFYLAYQELNNKNLLSKYGELCCRLMNEWQRANKIPINSTTKNDKIRLGIVGEQIRNHSVWNAITKGLVFNLDPSRFEIYIFHLGSEIDNETLGARLKVTSYINNYSSLSDWAKGISEKNIDALLYPEIGMDLMTTQLACLRLAPLQIACWGHPETTGLPTIDYYLSAELFEGESSQDAYTETLIKLPNLGCSYSRIPINSTKFDFEKYGIRPNEPLLVCPGTPYKYAPKYDWIYLEIVKRLGKVRLIFFNYQNSLTDILKIRLEKMFDGDNLILGDYVTFLPWLSPEEFYGLMKYADVYLDTIGFSGFNSAVQAVDCTLPIVTRKSDYMRGSFASGILKKMGIYELIANSDREYIELVIRLVQDSSYRKHIKDRIVEFRGIIYNDKDSIHAFENFLIDKVKNFN